MISNFIDSDDEGLVKASNCDEILSCGNPSTIQTVDITQNISDYEVDSILEKLEELTHLQNLSMNLTTNFFDKQNATSLTSGLSKCNQLKSLNLFFSKNILSKECIAELSTGIS